MGNQTERILIVGGGISGPSLALLLTRAGHKCVVLEKAPSFRTSGQQIDVAGDGLTVVQAMGLEEAVRTKRVEDDGLIFKDVNDKTIALFPTSNDPSSPVKEIEILRPEFAKVIYDATKENVEYRWDESVDHLTEYDDRVTVRFASSGRTEDFAIVIAADGLRSSTRELVFAPDNTEIVSLGQYASFYSIPWQESDGRYSRWHNLPGGRTLCLRPDVNSRITGAYLCQITKDSSRLARLPTEQQRKEVREIFANAGWEADRMLRELDGEAKESFYLQEVAQAKSKRLITKRIALLGDAGYCPSPVSGQGTTLALVGAYILAGCIATHEDPRDALRQYEDQVRPFVDKCQKLPPGVPWIVNPQTKAGIAIMTSLVWLAGKAQKVNLFSTLGYVKEKLSFIGGSKLELPKYPVLHANGQGVS